MSTTFTLKTPKPSNPLAGVGRSRRAGSHRRSGGALRQQASQELQRILRLPQDSP